MIEMISLLLTIMYCNHYAIIDAIVLIHPTINTTAYILYNIQS